MSAAVAEPAAEASRDRERDRPTLKLDEAQREASRIKDMQQAQKEAAAAAAVKAGSSSPGAGSSTIKRSSSTSSLGSGLATTAAASPTSSRRAVPMLIPQANVVSSPMPVEEGSSPPLPVAAATGPASATNGNSNAVDNHHTVIPQYPYNVSSQPYIPGTSSTRSDSYFEGHVPDDTNVQTRLPSICVDYLSHDWAEDDVWTSWKAMTKHKSEIANGVRLENASWRTWAKQRGKLKTISPETLNWLKDSDVTWLYGPLHTAVDPVPPAKAATAEDYLGLENSVKHRKKTGKNEPPSINIKPILKHRSLSDILSVPGSGAASPVLEGSEYSEDEEDTAEEEGLTSGSNAEDGKPKRPQATRTPSDPSVKQRTRRTSGSGSSPPRGVLSTNHARRRTSSMDSSGSAASRRAASAAAANSYEEAYHDLPARPGFGRHASSDAASYGRQSSLGSHLTKKRHITFNHRVEQCISVDVSDEEQKRGAAGARGGRGGKPYSNALQRYGSNTRASSSSSSPNSSSEDSEEDEVLTFRSSSPRSPSFVKPFLSPSDPNGPGLHPGASRQSSTSSNKPEPHTIARMAPTTLKESELLPGPTPIVVMEDGRVTALYGTEEDYIFDADEHGGMGLAPPSQDSDDEVGAMGKHVEAVHLSDGEHDYYNAAPATTVAQGLAANQSDPITSSMRFEDPAASLVNAPGAQSDPKSDYFSGPESALADDYDTRTSTSSQYTFRGSVQDAYTRGTAAGHMQEANASANSSTSVSPSYSSDTIGLSSSPMRPGSIPTKSILKKGREPNQSGEYYPPLPPASTRASRAHAAMFDDNGEEIIRSPRRDPIALPLDQAIEGAATGDSAPHLTIDTNSVTHGPPANHAEPVRGRSLSRGSSTSSLLDRPASSQALNADAYARQRSISANGSSVSPPPASSPIALGAGTAVMHTQPVDVPRGRGRETRDVQSTRPSSRRTALEYSSDEDSTSSSTISGGEADEAANLDLQADIKSTDYAPGSTAKSGETPEVYFARKTHSRNGSGDPGGTAKNNAAANKEEEEGFEQRPTSPAANVGRSLVSLFRSSTSSSKGTVATAADARLSQPSTSTSNATSASSSVLEAASQIVSHAQARFDMAGEGEGMEDAEAERLFESPYMPSSPTFLSSTNLPGLVSVSEAASAAAGNSGQRERGHDPYHVRWADRDEPLDKRRSAARSSLLKNLRSQSSSGSSVPMPSASSSTPLYRKVARQKQPAPSNDEEEEEDELSDPANNGYSYGYGFDLSDEEENSSKGVVGRAVDLVGALWNVGTGMVWRGGSSSSDTHT